MPVNRRGKQAGPTKGRVSPTGKPLRGQAQNDKRNGQRREKRLREKVAVLKAHVVEHIEAGIAKARGLKRKHTDPGSESSKEQWAILQAKQAIYKLNFTVLDLIRRKESLRRGERGAMPSRASIQLAAHQLALATKALLWPEIDTIKMVMPMRPLMEEMLRLSGWTQEHGVAPGPAGEFVMSGARTFRLCVTCDGAQLTKGNKGFIILCYKPLEPEIISAFTELGGGTGGVQSSMASLIGGFCGADDDPDNNQELAGKAIREVCACEGVPFVDSSTGLAINIVPSFCADMSCHWKMSGMGGPSHATGQFCIYCSCHNSHRGMKALWRCGDCLRLDPAEVHECFHHALIDSKELIAHDTMERAMCTAQENQDAQWRVESSRKQAATAEREAEEARPPTLCALALRLQQCQVGAGIPAPPAALPTTATVSAAIPAVPVAVLTGAAALAAAKASARTATKEAEAVAATAVAAAA
ncbi:hypothetical protein B484DRAFT_471262, partial [Ochromonadaceae sp. CCMP2298]